MRTLLTVGLGLSLAVFTGLSAKAGTPAPAPRVTTGGGLFVESAEGASNKLVVSGELRTRWEMTQNFFDFASGRADQTDWVDARARLGLAFELAAGTELKLTAQSAYLWGGVNGFNDPAFGNHYAEDRDSFDVYEAYVRMKPELFGRESTLTVGRQELSFGSEMLLGNDSKYFGASFDAVRLDVKVLDRLTSTLFAAKLVENSMGTFEDINTQVYYFDENNADAHRFGLWNTYELSEDAAIHFYVLYFNDNNAAGAEFNPFFFSDAKIWTIGAQVKFNKLELLGQKFDASAELAVQSGKVDLFGNENTRVQDAFAFELEAGWTMPLPWSPRLAVGMAFASGDTDPTDDRYSHFNAPHQDTSDRLGKADMFTLENIRLAYIEATCKPMDIEKLSVGLAIFRFETPAETDVQGIGGDARLGGDNENSVADEVDIFASYKLNENVDLKACLSWIEPADQIEDASGGNSPAQRFHVTMVVKF